MVRKCCIFCWVLCCLACSPRALQDAQRTVAQADSLRLERCAYNDSLSLAQAYETLGQWKWLYADAYAHACYHYGRLLREKENPVEAMRVFIDATHSHTRDFHILGRVYSNMGDICHLANEFDLSYDMFEHSADCFLRNRDSIAYYYALNDMAFELLMQEKRVEVLPLLARVANKCSDNDVLAKLSETKAYIYEQTKQYDSALIILDQQPWYNASKCVLKARAFEYQNKTDSALYYAQQVMTLPDASEQDKYNMLYILMNYNPALKNEELVALSAQRSDIETKVLISLHNQWTWAVRILEQDLSRKPDWRWLYIIIAIFLFVLSVLILYYIWRKRKQHYQIIRDIKEKEKEHVHLENTISNLSQLQETQHRQIIEEVETVCKQLINSPDIRAELCWNNYSQMCAIVNRRLFGIIARLQTYSLSEKEVRLCVLILLQADTKQMVDMIPYSQSGLGKFKYTTARKLGTTTANIRSFMLNLHV